MDDFINMDGFSERLAALIPDDKELVFVCIGTDRSTGDSYGPLIGTELQKAFPHIPVYGTLADTVNGTNVGRTKFHIEIEHPDKFVIAIDACLGKFDHVGWIRVRNEPIKPGAGVKKELPKIGDISITGVVNVAGFMEYHVLQNTSLHLVMEMARATVNCILEAVSMRNARLMVAAASECGR